MREHFPKIDTLRRAARCTPYLEVRPQNQKWGDLTLLPGFHFKAVSSALRCHDSCTLRRAIPRSRCSCLSNSGATMKVAEDGLHQQHEQPCPTLPTYKPYQMSRCPCNHMVDVTNPSGLDPQAQTRPLLVPQSFARERRVHPLVIAHQAQHR
jgi:hypothetical protein